MSPPPPTEVGPSAISAPPADERDLLRAVLDALPAEVVVLDAGGRIIASNLAWRRFNGAPPRGARIGDDYLAACRPGAAGGDSYAAAALAGLSALLAGERDELSLTYPCAAPDGSERWFWLDARRVGGRAGGAVAVVSHTDISAVKAAERTLREADERKDRFLATLAHELRNPLAPIRHGVEILRRAAGAGATVQTAAEAIDRQVRQMTRLIDDLLNVSRISTGRLTLVRQPLDLAEAVQAAAEACRPLLDERAQPLLLALPPQPLWVDGDLARLTQVVGNLINNAARFSAPGQPVEVLLAADGGQALLRVRDQGVGIAPDAQAGVWDVFAQGAGAAGDGGLGIGLWLVRELVQMHGGSATLHSAGLGQGTEVSLRLPLRAAGQHGAGSAAPADLALRGLQVLVADDNREAADTLAELLSLLGGEVAVAYDGEQALALAGGRRFDLALLDISMPKMDGLQAAQAIRALPGPVPRLVALTGLGADRTRQAAREAGFDAYLLKPLDLQRLAAALQTAAPAVPAG